MCLAVPGRLIEINPADDVFRTGRVSFGGVVKQVSLAFVPEARVNDYVLVHVGVALSVVDEEEAAQVLESVRELDGFSEFMPRDDLPPGGPQRARP